MQFGRTDEAGVVQRTLGQVVDVVVWAGGARDLGDDPLALGFGLSCFACEVVRVFITDLSHGPSDGVRGWLWAVSHGGIVPQTCDRNTACGAPTRLG